MPVGVHQEPQRWAEEQFAGAKLTDVRRVARVGRSLRRWPSIRDGVFHSCVAARMPSKRPTIFSNTEDATPENIQAGHRAVVREEMQRPGCICCLEDTTELSWSGKQAIAGLGPSATAAQGSRVLFAYGLGGTLARRPTEKPHASTCGRAGVRRPTILCADAMSEAEGVLARAAQTGSESRKSGRTPVHRRDVRRQACGGSGWRIAKRTFTHTWRVVRNSAMVLSSVRRKTAR